MGPETQAMALAMITPQGEAAQRNLPADRIFPQAIEKKCCDCDIRPQFKPNAVESDYAGRGGLHNMTKADLVEKVTGAGELTRRDGEVIVETIFDAVIGALKSGDKIEIRGFGSFRIRQRNPRIGRNPKTGARVEVPAKKVPYFKPSKELRDLVNPQEAAKAS
jgi:integration host factor subunit beta